MHSFFASTLSLLHLGFHIGSALAAKGPSTSIRVGNAVVSPDGFTRPASVVDGVIDRAIITGKKGDTFNINVINELQDPSQFQSTSIHWHGMIQRHTTWADGAAFVSQCPVAKGDSFLYRFKGEFAGTYWFHSHLSTQYCDGMRGALIIYDPKDPHKYLYDVDDDSTVISLSDWYHTVSRQLAGVPRADSTLINGLGRSVGFETSKLAVITVKKGVRYRFRLINMACDPNYTFHIDNHTMKIIEADGVSHNPVVADQVQIFVAQRYSFILEANQPIGNYWIRAAPNIAVDTSFNNGLNSAILRYKGAKIEEPPTQVFTPAKPLVETSLAPVKKTPAVGRPVPGGVDIAYNFNIGFNFTAGRFLVNNFSYVSPTVPVLLQVLSGAKLASDLMPFGSIYPLKEKATVELSIPAFAIGGPHPFHLHGHVFQVVRSAGSSVYNYENPPQRDVVSIGNPGDNVTIRFTADNSGVWFLHCHIDFHLEAGLAVVFAEDQPDIRKENPTPKAWDRLCDKYNAQPVEDHRKPANRKIDTNTST